MEQAVDYLRNDLQSLEKRKHSPSNPILLGFYLLFFYQSGMSRPLIYLEI